MISQTPFKPQKSQLDWNLVFQTLSGTAGVFIGLVIANSLGWI
jgi:hypothetical protein